MQVQMVAVLHFKVSFFFCFRDYSNSCIINIGRYVSLQSEEQAATCFITMRGFFELLYVLMKKRAFSSQKLLLSVNQSLNFKEMAVLKVLGRYCKETNIPDILIFSDVADVSSVIGEGSTRRISYDFKDYMDFLYKI